MHHSEDFLRLADEARKRIREVTPEEARRLLAEGALLLDVRDAEEFAGGHLEGARNLSRGKLEMKIGELAPDKAARIVCYCSAGNRGALAADTLRQMGYGNATSLAGGMRAFAPAARPKG